MIRAQDFTQSRRFGALAFLLIAYFFYAWSWNTVDILRPYIKESLGLTDLQAGSSYTLQSIGAIFGAVVMGQIADKIGRRNALVISMFGYGTGLLSALLVSSYTGLIFQRIALGFFMGSMFVSTRYAFVPPRWLPRNRYRGRPGHRPCRRCCARRGRGQGYADFTHIVRC